MESFNMFIKHHQSNDDDLRLGQRFCIMYISGSFPALFYAGDQQATKIIREWLTDHQYYNHLPKVFKRFEYMEVKND